MPKPIDAYHQWLGIPPSEQPPNAYRLLGVRVFEADLGVIRTAADRQIVHLRTYQLGEYSDLSQRLLNEVASARALLLDPKRKAEYDRRLSSKPKAAAPTPKPPADPLAELLAEPEPTAWLVTPKPRPPKAAKGSSARRRPSWVWKAALPASAGIVVLLLVAGWSVFSCGNGGPPAPSFDSVLAEALELARNGHHDQAVARLGQFMETAKGDNWQQGQIALSEMKQALSDAQAMKFWLKYKLDELRGFQEKGRLPEDCWHPERGNPFQTPGMEDIWRLTLERTLPAAVKMKEPEPPPVLIVTGLLPVGAWPDPEKSTAAEDVAAQADQFYNKVVDIDDAWLDARTAEVAGQGLLLSVTSAAGTRFPAQVDGNTTLLFTAPKDVYQQLQQRLAGKDRLKARLFCKIDRGKVDILSGRKTFPKATVYKVEVYP